jgi:hypothetical protein
MPPLTPDQIGRLAELVAATDLSRPVMGRYHRPLFRATWLGDKYPAVDFLVDVLGRKDTSLGFFFAQVKGTAPARAQAARLSIDVPRERFNQLVRLPVPTYLIGVDVNAEVSYLVAAHRSRRARVSGMTKAYCLRDDAVKIGLYREVLGFWQANKATLQRTGFKDV